MKHPALKYLVWLAVVGTAAWLPLKAHAYEGIVAADISLRAGPDPDFPAIALLPAGMPVSIEGCVTGWAWCDVIAGPDRGWVAGSYLQETWDDQPVFVSDYGAQIGIPIVAFTLGTYWDDYYRDRPWFGERTRWEHRHFAYRAPPRPSGFYHGGGYRGQDSRGGYHARTQEHGRSQGPAGQRQGAPAGQREAPGRQHYAHAMPRANAPHAQPAHQRSGAQGSHAPVAHNAAGRPAAAPHAAPQRERPAAPQRERPAAHPAPKREHGDDRDHHDH